MKYGPEERRQLEKTLAALPEDHPARRAAQRGADPVALIHLVEQDDVAEALAEVWYSAYRRRLGSDKQ
jgi:hypothetical protein